MIHTTFCFLARCTTSIVIKIDNSSNWISRWLQIAKEERRCHVARLLILDENLNSGCSMASSCSMAEKTKTISVMITGHKKVMCTALILKSDLNTWQIEHNKYDNKRTWGEELWSRGTPPPGLLARLAQFEDIRTAWRFAIYVKVAEDLKHLCFFL